MLLATFFSTHELQAIDFSRINIAWRYDPNASVRMEHRVVSRGREKIVFLRVSGEKLDRWNWEILVQDGYESEIERKLELDFDTVDVLERGSLVKFVVPDVEESLLVVKLIGYEEFLFYDIPLSIGSLSFPTIYPVDDTGVPIVESYFNLGNLSWAGDSSFLVMQYPERFASARPPMADMSMIPSVRADTAFYLTDSISWEDNYFYAVRRDSLATTAVTMLKTPPYFPEYRRLDELIEAMLYITTEQEKKSLLNSRNAKASFDSFWMNTFSTKAFARNAIRRYYNKIEQANKIFTDYMAGWKTDRGMIFIVYGKPEEVYRTGNTEEWYYNDGASFEFNIISSFFAPQTFTLRRRIELEEGWFEQVAAIRSGIE